MKSIINYGLFAGSLAVAAFLGHLFTERGYQMKPHEMQANQIEEQQAPQNQAVPEAKEPSWSDSRSTAENRAETKADFTVTDQAAAAKLKMNQATAKIPKVQPPEFKQKEAAENPDPANKKLAAASQPKPGLDQAESAVSLGSEEASADQPVARVHQLSPGSAEASDLDVVAILAPLLKLSDARPLGRDRIANKTLLVAVWSTWCGSCRQQLPNLDTLKRKINNPNVEIILLALDEHVEDIQQAIARQSIGHLVVHQTGQVIEQLQINAVPSVFLVDSRGKLQGRYGGYTAEDVAGYEQKILTLLNQAEVRQQQPVEVSALTGGD